MYFIPDGWARKAARLWTKCSLRAPGVTPESRLVNHLLSAYDQCSDGEFVQNIVELLCPDRGASPSEIELVKRALGESRKMRVKYVRRLLLNKIDKLYQKTAPKPDYRQCYMMGTGRVLTPSVWAAKAAELKLPKTSKRQHAIPEKFVHSGCYLVSAIASLYKGSPYTEKFLENITSQSIFDRSELIIIDANSPDREAEIIERYQNVYNNIIYERLDSRVGIYEAWNRAISLARGKYITNTNIDDLRRRDSFELQANALDFCAFADVTYQDVFYTLDHSLSFDDIEKFNFRSDAPLITAHNLLEFNWPHNAPMWRKGLHEEVGVFDTSFQSAGDWEFWLRCCLKGKVFWKVNTPHVAYFQNPEGISTRPDTPGIFESQKIIRKYSRMLVSKYLTMSRQSLANAVGVELDWNSDISHYDAIHRHLLSLGASRDRDGVSE